MAYEHQAGGLGSAYRQAVVIGITLFLGHASASVAEVYAVSGILTSLGQRNLLVLWALEALVAIAFAGAATSLLGRVAPGRILRSSARLCAVSYALLSVALFAGAPVGPMLGALAVLDKLLMNILFFAAWALGRDAFTVRDSVNYSGRINALGFLGSLAGSAAAGLTAHRGVSPGLALALLAVVFVVGQVLLSRVLAGGGSRSETLRDEASGSPPRAGLRETLAHIRHSPVLLQCVMLDVCNGVGYTVLAYEVLIRLAAVDNATPGALGRFALLYAGLRVAEPLAYTVVAATVAARIVARVPATRLVLATPTVLVVGLIGLVLSPSPLVAVAAACLLQIAFAIEAPLRSGVIAALRPEFRATVGTVSDGSFYQFGYLAGTLGLAIASGLGSTLRHDGGAVLGLETTVGVMSAILGFAAVARLVRLNFRVAMPR